MGIVKPAVSRVTGTVSASGIAVNSPCELVGIHYFNSTAGAGRVDVYDGPAIPANLRLTMGADAANGTDDYTPVQPIKFIKNVNVQFTTGTGVVTVTIN